MTDNTHPNNPETDAENYPSTLRITVGSADDVFERAIEQAGSEDTADEAVRTFESVAEIRKLLTDRRLEVMRAIMTETPDSISDLADRLGRNYADVHADVQVRLSARSSPTGVSLSTLRSWASQGTTEYTPESFYLSAVDLLPPLKRWDSSAWVIQAVPVPPEARFPTSPWVLRFAGSSLVD
jgi:hypothetical protein